MLGFYLFQAMPLAPCSRQPHTIPFQPEPAHEPTPAVAAAGPAPTVTQEVSAGPSPQQIAFGFKGLQGPNAYVTVAGLNRVVVLSADPANLRILEQIDVGQRPNGISGNREGTRLFVVHEISNDLKVIDTGSSAVLATVPVGRKPIRVVFHGS